MSRLFAGLYLDEDVDVFVATLVRVQGFSAMTASESNMLEARDDEQLAFAVREERVLVTHNRSDFEQLGREYYEQGRGHYGIVMLFRRSPHALADRLVHLLNSLTADELANQVLFM